MMTTGTLAIWSLSHSNHGTRMSYSDIFGRSVGSGMNCRGMGYWKRLIKIPGGADCYYCINNLTCLIHVCYCLVVLVVISDILSIIMPLVYFATLPDTCYSSCVDIYSCTRILCIPCILFYVYPVDTITV